MFTMENHGVLFRPSGATLPHETPCLSDFPCFFFGMFRRLIGALVDAS